MHCACLIEYYSFRKEYMKKKCLLYTVVLVIIVLSLLSILSGCAKVDLLKVANSENMFAYDSTEDAKKHWNLVYSGTSEDIYSFAENGLSMSVDGYAYASQEIKLKPNTYYKVSYNYEIETALSGTGENPLLTTGLFIGFVEDPNFNVTHEKKTNHISGKEMDINEPVVFYFKSDRSRIYNLKVALGTADLPVKGHATLNNLKIEQVKETVAKNEGKIYGLYNLKSTIFGKASVDNIVYIVLGCALVFVLGYIFYILKSRDLAFESIKSKNRFYDALHNNKVVAPAILVSLTILIRGIILAVQSGMSAQKGITESLFGFNLEQLAFQGQWIAKHGTVYFLKNNITSTFLPIPLYLASLAGVIGNTSSNAAELVTVSLLKLFAIFADIGTVLLIYRMISKRQGNTSALIMSSCYTLMPVMFLSSSAGWSVTSSFASLMLVAAFFFLLDKNYILSSIMYFFACMTSVASLLFIPAFVLYAGVYIVLGIRDQKIKESILAISLFVGFFFVFYLITLPFSIDFVKNGTAMHSFSHFITIVKGQNVYTLNAFNFQGLLKNNFVEITSQSTLVSILFVLFLVIIVSVLYIRTRNRLQLLVLTSGFSVMAWTFLNRMTPEVLILLLPVMFIGATLYKDKRLYFVFLLYTLTAYINLSYVHLIVGYNASGIIHIDYAKTSIVYVMGAINLLLVVYYVVVLYDILISKKLSVIKPIELKYWDHLKFQSKKLYNNVKLINVKIQMFFSALSQERKQRKLEKSKEKDIIETVKDKDEK